MLEPFLPLASLSSFLLCLQAPTSRLAFPPADAGIRAHFLVPGDFPPPTLSPSSCPDGSCSVAGDANPPLQPSSHLANGLLESTIARRRPPLSCGWGSFRPAQVRQHHHDHHGGGGGGDDEDDGDDDNECYRHLMTRPKHLPTTRPPAAAISSSGRASCLVRCSPCSANGPRAPAIFVSHLCSSFCLSILSSQRCPTTSVLGGTI